jgi:hypothetical protein
MYIRNLSKYIRVKPSEYAANHLAYIPSVSTFVSIGFYYYSALLSYPTS